ncbi:MAG: glycoside hydrolase family 2 protein [Eubacteriales bacterium]
MADFFASIAAGEIGTKRLPLVFPSPEKKNGILLSLDNADVAPLPVPEKMGTKKELDREIERLKKKYAPFMRRLAPKKETKRTFFPLTSFSMREATKEDISDFSRVIYGEGEWKNINIPYYYGPVGCATAYYRTVFNIKKPAEDRALFLHFDGADYIAEVNINGTFVGMHEGFFGAFEFDITPYVHDGENTLIVTLKNDYVYGGNQSPATGERTEGDKLYAATGFGYDDSKTGWHHCPAGFGICQKVYLEERPRVFISDIYVRPIPEKDEFEIWCEVYNCDYTPPSDVKLLYSLYGSNFQSTVFEDFSYEPITFSNENRGDIVSVLELSDDEKMKTAVRLTFYKGANLVKLRFKAENLRLWEPDTPYLYEAVVSLNIGGKTLDIASSRFGMRSFTQDNESVPSGMFYLNGKSIRLRGANTMGYEQQDVLRGDFDMLLYDMLMAKACNMNFLRLTQRPVQKEIYELCDSIGLMLQTDLPLFSVMRRTKFAEGVRQAEEMERLIRSHPSSILISYMNEPMANGANRPHRHLVRYELEAFFNSCDTAVRLLNPDRVIKHIDGDYDPPESTLPDNHCYCTWYNGHGIDIGKLHRGYWLGVKEGSYYGCGEFGAEGLDPVSLMRRRYPKEWLPQTPEEEKVWEPGMIKDAQSGNMHFFFYDTQDTLEDWVSESRKYQALATRIQTEAFRRDKNMVTFALHLFIDAWPSGWMKTVVDCEREPKPAFFAYRDALTPLMVSIRNDRKTVFANEKMNIELFICNDTHNVSDGHTITIELISPKGKAVRRGVFDAAFGENSSFMQGDIVFEAPEVSSLTKYILRAVLKDKNGNVIHYSDEEIEVFAREEIRSGSSLYISAEEFLSEKEKYLLDAKNGKTLVINGLEPGEYDIGGANVSVKSCGMRALHFVSRKTGHRLAEGFSPYDFRFWYEDESDMITPLLRRTFRCDKMTPILTSGNSLSGNAWGQKLYPALACAEMTYGKGKIVINEVLIDSHLSNPVARIFRNRLMEF